MGSPALAILGTSTDDPIAWMAAGQALAKVLLRAQAEGLSASFLNQAVEVTETRPRLAQLVGRQDHPQVLLRLGYGPETAPSPRRTVAEVLLTSHQ